MIVQLEDYITNNNYFKWKEALWLPSLKCYHSPSFEEVKNIKLTCLKLDDVRRFIAKPFNVHCWIRPTKVKDESNKHNGVNYNALVKGAKNSSHIVGLAIDFDITGLTTDQAMALIKPKLPEFTLAAENNNSANGRNWIHLQNRILSDGTWRVFDI